MLGCQAVAHPSTKKISFPTVSAVLGLDSWNYCSGEQGPKAQHLPLNVCLIWLH